MKTLGRLVLVLAVLTAEVLLTAFAALPPTAGHDGAIRFPLDNGKRQLVVFRGAYTFTGVASENDPSSAYRTLTLHATGAPELGEYLSQKYSAQRWIDWFELLDAPDENHANYAYQLHGVKVLSMANEGQGFAVTLQIGPVTILGRTAGNPMGTTIYRGDRIVKPPTIFHRG